MKSYLLKPSEEKRLGDKIEQHYLAEYSQHETQVLEKELSDFLREQMEKSTGQSPFNGIDAGSVKEKLNIVAATSRKDIEGLFQMLGSEAIR